MKKGKTVGSPLFLLKFLELSKPFFKKDFGALKARRGTITPFPLEAFGIDKTFFQKGFWRVEGRKRNDHLFSF
jgi:hypothetical protein